MNNERNKFFQVTAKNVNEKMIETMSCPEVLIKSMDNVVLESGHDVPSNCMVLTEEVFRAASRMINNLTRKQFNEDLVKVAVDMELVFPSDGGLVLTTAFLEFRRDEIRIKPPTSTMLGFTITVRGKPYTCDQLESLCHLLVAYEHHQRYYDNDPEAKVTFGDEMFTQKDVQDLLGEMMTNPLTKHLLKSFGHLHPPGGSPWDSDRSGNLIMRNRDHRRSHG